MPERGRRQPRTGKGEVVWNPPEALLEQLAGDRHKPREERHRLQREKNQALERLTASKKLAAEAAARQQLGSGQTELQPHEPTVHITPRSHRSGSGISTRQIRTQDVAQNQPTQPENKGWLRRLLGR